MDADRAAVFCRADVPGNADIAAPLLVRPSIEDVSIISGDLNKRSSQPVSPHHLFSLDFECRVSYESR
jgi:hypothetical protein